MLLCVSLREERRASTLGGRGGRSAEVHVLSGRRLSFESGEISPQLRKLLSGRGLRACRGRSSGTSAILTEVESPPSDPQPSGRSPEEDSRLFELLREQLRGLASANLRRQGPGHTLQTTALIHEVWLRLEGSGATQAYHNREHFLATAARAMRSVLVDHARRA